MKVSVEVTPTAVTVYPDRARVRCIGECKVEIGVHSLVIENLPLTLAPESVRVTGQGSATVRINSVDVKKQFFEETPQENVRELEAQIDDLNEQIRKIVDEKEGWEAHGRYLEGMRQSTGAYAKGLAKGSSSVADQLELVRFLQEQDSEMKQAVRELDGRAKALNKQLDKLTLELNQLSRRRKKQLFQAVVEVEVGENGTFSPEISYVVSQVNWRPLYDVRLNTMDVPTPTLSLSTLAEITQQTGQEWSGVSLAVSTARPALNQRLPKLHTWYVDMVRPPVAQPMPRAQPGAVRSQPMAEADARRVHAPESMAVMAVQKEADVAVAETVSSGTAVRFVIGGESDVPSDGTPHKTTLSQSHSQPKLDYLAVPKHTDAVFRRAELVNKTGAPLLDGQANLFVDDEFIGRTNLPFTAQDDSAELLFGVEDRITVSRELVKRDVDKKLLSDVRRTRYAYEIEVENLMDTAVTVELKDHVPISRSEEIKVKIGSISPAADETTDLNEMTWRLSLNSQQKRTVQVEFSAEHPRSLQVIGLP